MRICSRISGVALLMVLFASSAAAETPCPISNHYILDGQPCTQHSGPIAETPGWKATGDLNVARSGHAAIRLADGRVLVAGGGNPRGAWDSAELYDPGTGMWTMTGRMAQPRSDPIAVLLDNGEVLVIGGTSDGSAERYDPRTGTWRPTGSMHGARDLFAAVRLRDGRVLVAGGWNYADAIALRSAELYDPAAGTWTPTGDLLADRYSHTMTLLPDGRVLAARGSPEGDFMFMNFGAELYDPTTGTWSSAGRTKWASVFHAAIPLAGGKVLLTTGYPGGAAIGRTYASAGELFDAATQTWSVTSDQLIPRWGHQATTLGSGAVLITGGTMALVNYPFHPKTLAAVEWYDPARNAWSGAADMNVPRAGHSATVLADGRVLVAGGKGDQGDAYTSAEILQYQLATPPDMVIEYRDMQDFAASPGGHFFYTDDPGEVQLLDFGGPGRFLRTGRMFRSGGSKQVCRFYGSIRPGPNAHFYTISDGECAALRALQITPQPESVQQWNFEGLPFAAEPPVVDANGVRCPAGTSPIYRAYNNAFLPDGVRNAWDSMHRYSASHTDVEQMVSLFGWRDEGIAFCALQ